jgi:hypothetical protein
MLAALFPAALALAVDPGWSMVLWTIALFLAVEPILGQAVEPLLYGRSTGLSPVAVVVAAAFWTWLWGPVGLLLSTPVTLCLVVIGRHVERLEFLDIMLGDRPGLSPEENFYQRLLADDPAEAADQAETYLKDHSLVDYYDSVALPGLSLAQLDVNRGRLDRERQAQIRDAVLEVIDDLAEHAGGAEQRAAEAAEDEAREEAKEQAREEAREAAQAAPPAMRARLETPPPQPSPQPPPAAPVVAPAARDKSVLCIGGRGALDEAAAAMLCQLLHGRGLATRAVAIEAVTAANIARLDVAGVAAICLSYVEPGGLTNARYLVRRLHRRLPGARVLVGFWTLDEDSPKARDGARQIGADRVVTSLRGAVEALAPEPTNGRNGGGNGAIRGAPATDKNEPAPAAEWVRT